MSHGKTHNMFQGISAQIPAPCASSDSSDPRLRGFSQ